MLYFRVFSINLRKIYKFEKYTLGYVNFRNRDEESRIIHLSISNRDLCANA